MGADNIVTNFSITSYGTWEKYNEVISKRRCRVFYKGANRNSTFITDEFAEKLITSFPYTPVKGIFSEEEKDFTDHGKQRSSGNIYGLVPAEPNFAWEQHVDSDGITRTYACVDVLYYSGIYGDAREISDKSQSMELYKKSIKGSWKLLDGKKYYVYEDACFLGLQVLGDSKEPCFEGAAFYELFQSIEDFISKVKKNQNNGQGGQKMPGCLFKLSDDQKNRKLWELLNPIVNENGYREYHYSITDVYDDYALAYSYEDNFYKRVYYKKDDEKDTVEILKQERVYIVDVTEREKAALDTLRSLNNGTYDKVDEVYGSINGLKDEISELNTKIVELNGSISTLTTERDEFSTKFGSTSALYETAQNTITSLTTERDSLISYKKDIEEQAKLAVINTYSSTLTEEVLKKYKSNLENYTCEELDMRLTYEQKQAHPNMFQKQGASGYVPKDEPTGGIETILARYERKK